MARNDLDPQVVPTDPNTLLEDSKCNKCIPKGEENAVIIYLLQQIAQNTMTPNELMEASKCFKCIPAGMQTEVIIYLLDQINQAQ